MNAVYAIAGASKQAHHQYVTSRYNKQQYIEVLRDQVDQVRDEHPGCGLEKLYWLLRPEGIGRDKFIAIFQQLGYGVKKRRLYHRTTIPTQVKFPNLITGMRLDGPNQLWQSDITYVLVKGRFYYLVFMIDAYTKVIKGHAVSDHLKAEANIKTLKMAIKSTQSDLSGLIHHSDRGSQYIERYYQHLLLQKGVYISMGLQAQENAYAERINGTIKNEYLIYRDITTFEQLKREVKRAIKHYNHQRPHNHLPERMTPWLFEQQCLSWEHRDRPTVIVYAEGKNKLNGASSPFEFTPRTGPLAHDCPIVIK